MNKETDIWGAFSYDSKKDVLRYDVKVEKTADLLEAFSISFEKGANGSSGYLTMGWDDVIARLPFTW